MKRIYALTVLLVFFALFSLGEAQESLIPFYHSQVDFLLTAPGVEGSAIAGFVNPAALGMLPGSELQFFWSDEKAQLKSLKRWGLFAGIPHLGLGVIHHKLPSSRSVTDYRLALATGNKAMSFGLGYGWSSEDMAKSNRDDLFLVGLISRPCQFASLGIA